MPGAGLRDRCCRLRPGARRLFGRLAVPRPAGDQPRPELGRPLPHARRNPLRRGPPGPDPVVRRVPQARARRGPAGVFRPPCAVRAGGAGHASRAARRPRDPRRRVVRCAATSATSSIRPSRAARATSAPRCWPAPRSAGSTAASRCWPPCCSPGFCTVGMFLQVAVGKMWVAAAPEQDRMYAAFASTARRMPRATSFAGRSPARSPVVSNTAWATRCIDRLRHAHETRDRARPRRSDQDGARKKCARLSSISSRARAWAIVLGQHAAGLLARDAIACGHGRLAPRRCLGGDRRTSYTDSGRALVSVPSPVPG